MNFSDINQIVYLGPDGTYSQIAAELFAKKFSVAKKNFLSLTSIKSIIDYADKNNGVVAVVPIENSIEGVVRETIDNLTLVQSSDLKIVAEFVIPINNCLLAKEKIAFNDVKTLLSYTQPLAQCRNFINKELPKNLNIKETQSTAQAAKLLLEAPNDWAAVANRKAAEIYGLSIIAENINDIQNNKTRFVVLAKNEAPQTGNDKTSIVISTLNEVGALWTILNIFKKYDINLSYIDSRPSAKNLKEYNFYLDFDGHYLDEKIKKALMELHKYIIFYRHNGSYSEFAV